MHTPSLTSPQLPSVENNACPGPSLWTMLTCVCTFFLRSLCCERKQQQNTRAWEHNSNTPFQPVSVCLTVTAPFETPQQQVIDVLYLIFNRQQGSSHGCSHVKLSWVTIKLESANQNQDCGKETTDPLLCNQTQELRTKCQPAQKATT